MSQKIIQRFPRIMVTGVSGVGKSYILQRLADKTDYDVFQYGKSMKRCLEQVTGDADIDISTLPLETRRLIQTKTVREVENLSEARPVIIDGHLFVEQTSFGENSESSKDYSFGITGISGEDYDRLDLDGIIQIIDKPSEILLRRKDKPERYKQFSSDEQFIDEFQTDLRGACLTYSVLFGCFYYRLDLRTFDLSDDPRWQNPKDRLESVIGDMISAQQNGSS